MAEGRAMSGWAFILLFIFWAVMFVIVYDYFKTPDARLIPLLAVMLMFVIAFVFDFGEIIGVAAPFMAQPLFESRGGLTATFIKIVPGQGGMWTVYFSTYTRYARHCRRKYAEDSTWRRFLTMLTPARVISVTDHRSMFEYIPAGSGDTPEGCWYYHGAVKDGASINSAEDSLRRRLTELSKVQAQLHTGLERAHAAAEAAARGDLRKGEEVSNQLSGMLDNLSRHQQQQPVVLEERGRRE